MSTTKRPARPTEGFEHWVADHEPGARARWGEAYWHYVELIHEWARKFDARAVEVVGVNQVRTPPPEETVRLPIVRMTFRGASVVLRHDFAGWPGTWKAGLWLRRPLGVTPARLFDPRVAASPRSKIVGLALPPYDRSPKAFSCRLYDDWDIATLLRLSAGAKWYPRFGSRLAVPTLFRSQKDVEDDEPVDPEAAGPARRIGRRRSSRLSEASVRALRRAQREIRKGNFFTEEEVLEDLEGG